MHSLLSSLAPRALNAGSCLALLELPSLALNSEPVFVTPPPSPAPSCAPSLHSDQDLPVTLPSCVSLLLCSWKKKPSQQADDGQTLARSGSSDSWKSGSIDRQGDQDFGGACAVYACCCACFRSPSLPVSCLFLAEHTCTLLRLEPWLGS